MQQNNGLQLLRFVAAGLVLLVHLPTYALFPFFSGDQRFFSGAIGVDVFFCISGLVMYLSVGKKAGTNFAMQFAIRRLFRVVPLYFLLTVLLFAMLSVRQRSFGELPACLAKSLVFSYCNDNGRFADPIIPMGWSLNYEMFFYFCLLVCLAIFKREVIHIVAVLLAAIALFGWLTNDHVYYLNSIVIEFVFGILLGIYGSKVRNSMSKPVMKSVACLVVFLFLAAMLGIDGPESDPAAVSRMTIYFGAAAWPRWVAWGLPSLFVCALFYWSGNRVPASIARLGDFSYAIYLSQVLVLALYGSAAKFISKKLGLAEPPPSILHTFGIFILTFVMAYVLHYWVELPWMRRGKTLGQRAADKTGLSVSRP